MLHFILFFLVISFSTAQYSPSWDSLDSRPIPTWWKDAKFGIKIHWGVYSVPSWAPVGSYAEWYWHDLTNTSSDTAKHHQAIYGDNVKYPDFASSFKCELWDVDFWADLIKSSGAKYVVATSKHHDGFSLWSSAVSWNWNSVDVGPHRPLILELGSAIKKRGLKMGAYYSLYEWFHPLYLSNPSQYVDEVMLPQLYDLVSVLEPDIVFADGEWDHVSSFWSTPSFLTWLFNESPVKDTVVINDRWGNETRNNHGGYFTPEYNSTVFLDHSWEESMGMDLHSFGYNRATPASLYWSSDYLVRVLIRAVANNGALLLNIGPAADGTIPTIMQERLLDIGAWLSVNGESIYGSRVWRRQHEGASIDNATVRYTVSQSQSTVYAFVLTWPIDNVLTLEAPQLNDDSKIRLLGQPNLEIAFKFPEDGSAGCQINMPRLLPTNATSSGVLVWVFAIENAK